MAERRKSTTSTRRRERSGRDEREELDEEPEALEEDEIVDADESGEADDEMPEADESDEPPERQGRAAMTAGEAAKVALRQIATLTSKQPEGVTEIARTEDGWTVGVELVEDQRIPSSADILATYETTVDADGELVSYRRVKRYARGRGDAEE